LLNHVVSNRSQPVIRRSIMSQTVTARCHCRKRSQPDVIVANGHSQMSLSQTVTPAASELCSIRGGQSLCVDSVISCALTQLFRVDSVILCALTVLFRVPFANPLVESSSFCGIRASGGMGVPSSLVGSSSSDSARIASLGTLLALLSACGTLYRSAF
jgi:hypothetical protein